MFNCHPLENEYDNSTLDLSFREIINSLEVQFNLCVEGVQHCAGNAPWSRHISGNRAVAADWVGSSTAVAAGSGRVHSGRSDVVDE